jgi:hypothetical protein
MTDEKTAAANTTAVVTTTSTAPPPENLQITNEQVQLVLDSVAGLLHGRKPTQALMFRVIANAMAVTAKMKVQNHLKKQIVICAIERYIKKNSDLNEDEVNVLMAFVDVTINDAIDTISDVAKKRIDTTGSCCVIV